VSRAGVRLEGATAASYAACGEIVRRRAGNFFHGLRLTPSPQREGLFALYAWMREADDLVDGEEWAAAAPASSDPALREAALDEFLAATEEALQGRVPEGLAIWPAFVDTAERWSLPAEPFREMVEGQRQDLTLASLPDWPALRLFCRRVASTVGELCVRIWGLSDRESLALAEAHGIAFQLTNILRDLREDAARGRTYLPQEDLDAAGIDAAALLRWSRPEESLAALAPTIRRAREHYDEAAPLEERLPAACRPTLWAMTRIYRGLFERIEANPAIVARGPRVRLSTFRKAVIAWQARRLGARWQRSPVPQP
jgi:phytoene synthase